MNRMKQGFSLVELSIVLVILGLLVGGILAGQSLIRASELRTVGVEYQRYATAANAFRDKYFALPGDMSNATAFWGKDNTNCSGHTGTAASPGACNGNGNTILEYGAAAAPTEFFQFWKHLQLAGLIEGTYSGLAGPNGGFHTVLGTNGPLSKVNGAGWAYFYLGNYAGDSNMYAGNYYNTLVFGRASTSAAPDVAELKPEEAWNIDTKNDDGMPGTGKILARYRNNACSNSTSATDYASTYRLSDDTKRCTLWFTRAF